MAQTIRLDRHPAASADRRSGRHANAGDRVETHNGDTWVFRNTGDICVMTDMLTCTRDFEAEYYGQRLRLRAGRDRVAHGHELVGRFPNHFAAGDATPTTPARGKVSLEQELRIRRERLADLAKPTPKVASNGGILGGHTRPKRAPAPSVTVTRRDAAATMASPEIVVSARARRAMLDSIPLDAENEIGGPLLGELRHDAPPRVFDAAIATYNETRTSLQFDLAAMDAADASLRRYNRHQGLIGDFHSHPQSTKGRPSETDMRGWAAALNATGEKQYFGIIVTPRSESYSDGGDRLSWARPQFHGWCVSRLRGERLVCERARVTWG